MEYDYSKQDPLAQWRASMSIAYEFMDQMKAQGIYDSSTIIIMADHGPNEPTRNRLEQFDINFDGDYDANPMSSSNVSHASLYLKGKLVKDLVIPQGVEHNST